MELKEKIKNRLDFIYKSDYDENLIDILVERAQETKKYVKSKNEKWTEKDILLITYGDSISNEADPPLNSLKKFINQYLKEELSYVHILPFYPYSSDDGFSVIDYRSVNAELGEWEHIEALAEEYKLMFDLVINHISQHSKWYQNYLKGKNPGAGYFIEANPKLDLSKVVRPRSLPLLTPAHTSTGVKHVWTTFSEDQIDLNFANPELLAEMVDIFLMYIQKGATMIRLDAIAFLWKEIGTNCLHLPETHEFVKLLRDITDFISPSLVLLTETNVPNNENLSYFGNNDEANMIYQFSLPPLLLQALFSSNTTYLTQWAKSIPELPAENTFFNFTASHDGIGVRPLEGLLPQNEFDSLLNGMKKFGGKINNKRNPDGTNSPYEMNITYYDALKGSIQGEDNLQEQRFICSQTVMMTLQGMPALYIHSLLGTHNYYEGVKETGMNRTINRRKWQESEIYSLLNEDSSHFRILSELKKIMRIRKTQPAFHPNASQEIIDAGEKLFIVSRKAGELISISNFSNANQVLDISRFLPSSTKEIKNLISGKVYSVDSKEIELSPYQTVWMVKN